MSLHVPRRTVTARVLRLFHMPIQPSFTWEGLAAPSDRALERSVHRATARVLRLFHMPIHPSLTYEGLAAASDRALERSVHRATARVLRLVHMPIQLSLTWEGLAAASDRALEQLCSFVLGHVSETLVIAGIPKHLIHEASASGDGRHVCAIEEVLRVASNN